MSANQNRDARWMRRRALFDFGLAVGNDGKRGMRRRQLRAGRPPRHRVAGENESKTPDVRCTAYACVPAEARFNFLTVSPQSLPSTSPSKTPWAWPDGPPVESSGDTAVFPEINRLRPYYTTLIIVFHILQASIPTSGPARSIGCNLLQLKVANVFSIPLSAGC